MTVVSIAYYNCKVFLFPGYSEPQLKQTNLDGPKLFVITEFDCILKYIFYIVSTIKPLLTATSEQRLPVNNDRPKSPALLNLL